VTYSTSEIRDQVIRSPMQRGLGEAYDLLTSLLSNLEGPSTNDRSQQ
jgi:hypothetical protein